MSGHPHHRYCGKKVPASERFWRYVEKSDGCWLWTGTRTRDGYGTFHVSHSRSVAAHRFAYQLLVGPIPAGLQLDHVRARGCTSHACVNPAHLEPVTQRVNILRGDSVVAQNSRRTHCAQGHVYDPSNTQYSQGARRCAECHRTRQRRYEAAKRRERVS
jgi:hypothetical protein